MKYSRAFSLPSQSPFTIFIHPLSIGLGVLLVIIEGAYMRTGNVLYKHMTQFWIRIFALIFGIGVATGIVMEFEFGTNWATYSRYIGYVFGSARHFSLYWIKNTHSFITFNQYFQ